MSEMSSLKMDLSKTGLLMFFKPWQLANMKLLWDKARGLSSGEVWDGVDKERSRASVINFLEAMTLEGLLSKYKITGKGGHRGIYEPTYNELETREYLKRLFNLRLYQL